MGVQPGQRIEIRLSVLHIRAVRNLLCQTIGFFQKMRGQLRIQRRRADFGELAGFLIIKQMDDAGIGIFSDFFDVHIHRIIERNIVLSAVQHAVHLFFNKFIHTF